MQHHAVKEKLFGFLEGGEGEGWHLSGSSLSHPPPPGQTADVVLTCQVAWISGCRWGWIPGITDFQSAELEIKKGKSESKTNRSQIGKKSGTCIE
jgi:hypothetical protein